MFRKYNQTLYLIRGVPESGKSKADTIRKEQKVKELREQLEQLEKS